MTIFDKVKKLCSDKGISIHALEKETKIGNGTISRWKESSPTLDKIKKIADYFEKPIEYFLGEV